MGQSFRAVNITKGSFLSLTDHTKLMEHSYRLNSYMLAVEELIQPNGAWYKDKIVWAGDYADDGLFVPEEHEENLYDCTKDGTFIKITPKPIKKLSKYLFNHDKKQFINMEALPSCDDGWTIHPLSLLTAIGNGEGSGDFYTSDKKMLSYVGSWAGDSISAEDYSPVDYKEIKPDFIEK